MVDMRHRQYTRDHLDLWTTGSGGALSVHRYYEQGKWHWNFDRDNLEFGYDGVGNIREITRTGVKYQGSSINPNLFIYKSGRIVKTGDSYRWTDQLGYWVNYDEAGRLMEYGLRNKSIYRPIYEGDKVTGLLDRNGNQAIWFTYTGNNLTAASDAAGRTVRYTYQDDLLRTVTDLRDQITSFSYTGGRLSRVEEPGGKVRNITYNQFGDVVTVQDGQGIGHSFEYDYDKGTRQYYAYTRFPSGKVKEVWYTIDGDVVRVDVNGTTTKSIKRSGRTEWLTDERGYVTRHDRDEWDNIIYTLYPDNTWVERSYSRPWNLLTSVNQMGIITRYEYDGDGRRTAMIEAAGTEVERRTEYSYTATGKFETTTVKGSVDDVTRFDYDAADQLFKITDPEGRTTTFTDYHPSGNPQTVTDGRGIVKRYTYDDAGNLLTVRDHDNKLISEFRYDDAGNRASVLNAYLKEYKLVYDPEHRVLETEDPLGYKQAREYSFAGKPTVMTDQEGNTTTYTYDNFERVSRVTDSEGNVISYTYADPGGCSSCSGGIDLATSIAYPTFTREMSYDSRKRLIAQKDIYGDRERLTRYEYDEHGRLVTLTDPEGKVTSSTYDALGQKVSEIDALGNNTGFGYDSRGNMIRLEEPEGPITYFEYDRSNRLVKETKPLQQELRYSYDQAGNLATMIDGNGRKSVYTYDNNTRLVKSEIFANSSATTPEKTVTWSYNDAGSLTGYDDGTTTGLYGYDDLQRRVNEAVNYGPFTLTHSYSFDPTGRKKTYTDPAGRIRTYSYDKAGRPTAVDLGNAGQVSYNGYTWNRPNKITLPGGATLAYGHDGLQQLTGITAKDPAANPLVDYGYSRSDSGQVTKKATEHGDYDYNYDNLYRLTQATSPQNGESYDYDAVGNRLSSAEESTWNYNDNNQLTGYGNNGFVYDNHGNMTKKTVGGVQQAFSYTPDNRLAKVADGTGAAIATYYYDPFGRRLWKEVGVTRTNFHYNDEGFSGEYTADGTELRTYGYHPGSSWTTSPLFVQENNQYYWYLNDHLGTPQKIIAENGAVVWEALYDAFGRATILTETVANHLRFPGQYYDAETGLHYNWHRFYDPETGRYITADPIGLDGGMNLYAYVQNNPVNWVDPEGESYIYYVNQGLYYGTLALEHYGLDGAPGNLYGIVGPALVWCADNCGNAFMYYIEQGLTFFTDNTKCILKAIGDEAIRQWGPPQLPSKPTPIITNPHPAPFK